MEDFLIVLILAALVTIILRYLVRAKKHGETCIGCPHGKACKSACGGHCSCGNQNKIHT